jgi:hypothetical protein
VFFNSACFLRIRRFHFGRRGGYLEVLDDTRIHPMDYDLARQMASDALDVDNLAEDEENPSQYVEELMGSKESAAKLNDLDLDGYADELEKRLNMPKRLTLSEIKSELQNPYGDPRALAKLYPSIEDLFFMITKEPVSKFFPGSIVLGRIRKKLSSKAFLELPGGVEGLAEREEFDAISGEPEGAVLRVAIVDIINQTWKTQGTDLSTIIEVPSFSVRFVSQNWNGNNARKDVMFDSRREEEEERKRAEGKQDQTSFEYDTRRLTCIRMIHRVTAEDGEPSRGTREPPSISPGP